MALPIPDYPVDFPTQSAVYLGGFVIERLPVEKRQTAWDQAWIIALYAAGKIKPNIGPNVIGDARVVEADAPMTDEELQATARQLADSDKGDGASVKAIGPVEVWTLIKFALTIIKLLKG